MIMTLRKIFCMLSCMLTVSACGGETPVPGPNEGNQGGNEGGGEGSGPAYYISYSRGSDSNPGTSPDAPWKTLDRINRGTFEPGDRILLKSGDTWNSVTVINSKFTGTAEKPIVISSYGDGAKPRLTAPTAPAGSSILTINNSDHLVVENLEVSNGTGYGLVMGINDGGTHGDIVMRNIHTADMPYVGIWFNAEHNRNVEIVSCTSERTMHLFAVSGGTNIDVTDCKAEYCHYGGYSIIGVKGGTMKNCKSLYGGQEPAPQGTCGLFLGIVDGYEVVDSEFAYQQRLGTDPDGEGIDFERNNRNVVIRNCHMHDNAGCAIMFFESGGGSEQANDHCTIENCRFENNHRNARSPRGFEIHFSHLDDNNYGVIRNNTFDLPEGVMFVSTADPSVTIEGNKLADGTPLVIAPAYTGSPAVANGGFESPALEYGKYEHRPMGGVWTFRGNSGVARYGSDFNPPPAPEGSQVLFLQGASDVTQWVSLAAGSYKLTCKASYRENSGLGQSMAFYVDGRQVSDMFSPADATAYTAYESNPFTVEEGVRMIEIRSFSEEDKTVFVDDIALVPVQ